MLKMLTRRTFMIAGATSAVLLPALPQLARADTPQNMKMSSLYASKDSPDLSDAAKSFEGAEVTMNGFMAPPLKPDAKFFVLATDPMMICPFCDAASQWPQNIVLVYTKNPIQIYNYDVGITVTGQLDLGEQTDADTGFVSMVRLVESTYKGRPTVTIGF
jgi:hypothetical protein